MATTELLQINQWTGNEYPKRADFVEDNKKIDDFAKFQNIPVEDITFSANVYNCINTKYTPADYYNGMTLKLIGIPSDSTGSIKINYNNLGEKPLLKKVGGNTVSNFKEGGVNLVTYINGNFILASGGVDDVSFSASDLLETKTANNSDGEKVPGTMKNVGQQTATINAGGKVTITKGYHDGTGYVQSNSMSKQLTDLGTTLTSADQLISGIKAVDKNGNLIVGTATIQSLGGLRIKTGSGTYTPTYNVATNSYGNKYLESETLTIPLNLDFEPKILIALLPVYRYTSTMDCPFIWDMYSKKYIEGIVNFPYNSSTSWNNAPSSKDITSIGKKEVNIKASNLASNGTWRFESTGTVSNSGNTLIIKPVPVTWWALG